MTPQFVVTLPDRPDDRVEAPDAERALADTLNQAIDNGGLTPGDIALLEREEIWIHPIVDVDQVIKDVINRRSVR